MDPPSKTRYFAGIVLILIVNFALVVSSYVVKATETSAADIILFKGLVQTPVYIFLVCSGFGSGSSNVNAEDELTESSGRNELKIIPSLRRDRWNCVAYAVVGALRYAAQFAGVLFLPMSDYIVIVAATPICSYIFSRWLLKTKLTVFKTACCMTVVVGILLVVQPPLVFGGSEQDDPAYELHSNDTDDGYRRRNNRSSSDGESGWTTPMPHRNSSSEPPHESLELISKFSFDYLFGVLMGLTFALAGGLGNVIPCYCKKVSTKVLMVWGGFGCIFISFILPVIPKIEMNTIFNIRELSVGNWVVIILLAIVALAVQQLTIIGAIWTSPTALAMVRRTEILYVMVIDIIYFKVYPNPTGVAGYLLVFFSVIGMAASDKIQNWINNLSYCTKIRSMLRSDSYSEEY